MSCGCPLSGLLRTRPVSTWVWQAHHRHLERRAAAATRAGRIEQVAGVWRDQGRARPTPLDDAATAGTAEPLIAVHCRERARTQDHGVNLPVPHAAAPQGAEPGAGCRRHRW